MKSSLFAAFAATCALSGSAQAVNIISGKLWHVSEAISQAATLANVPGVTPDVTFNVNSPFNFSGTSVSVGTWLASSSASGIVENTAGTLASLMDNGTQGTLLDFTGFVTVTNGQTFTVTHDDGLTLIIGGIDLGFNAGPTAPTTSTITYTGPTGNFAFELVYGECCGGPAVLQVDLPFTNVVPEGGSTLPLLSGTLAALGLAARRFRRKI